MKKLHIFIVLLLVIILAACSNNNSKDLYLEDKTQKEDINLESKNDILEGEKENLLIDLYKNAVLDFSYSTASKLLEDENVMYSPISYYFALSQLSEVTAGKTQDELLNALLIDDLNVLRNGNENLIKLLNYQNDESTLSIANSIWLSKKNTYKDEPLQILANKYFSSSFDVDFTDDLTKDMIEDWISENTGGKLGKGDFQNLNPATIFLLLNTTYFMDEWKSMFNNNFNVDDYFDGVGKVTYMKSTTQGYYLETNEYETSYLEFRNGMRISFVLPKDNINDFIKDEALLKKSLNNNNLVTRSIRYKIPKFNYKSSFDLVKLSRTLGINEIFDNGDFTTLSDKDINLSTIYQKTFIEIDETGAKAGAYTAAVGYTTSIPPHNFINFTLDKPFIYAIYSGDYPIFIGVMKNPSDHGEFNYN